MLFRSFDARFAAEVKDYDAEAHFGVKDARKISLFIQYAVVAAQEAMANATANTRVAAFMLLYCKMNMNCRQTGSGTTTGQ